MTVISKRDLFTAALGLATVRALGQSAPAGTAVPAAAQGNVPANAQAALRSSQTRHSGVFNGRKVDYVATVAATQIADAKGTPTASLVCTSYVAEGGDPAQRPVLFVFNGGPSSSSATLHMLALGPQRMQVEQDPSAAAAPAAMSHNALTVLDVADLVFVDPAETGFSRILQGGKREYFYSISGDAQSISDLIVAWVRNNGRERSPKYVLGESYGTMRAALMAGQLAQVMPLDGVFLFGQAVNMIETSQRAHNALAYATNLPALAAIAAYHGKASMWNSKSLAAIVDSSYAWGMGEYLQALVRGNDLPERQRRRIATTLESMTGISTSYYLANRLAITKTEFSRQLLKDSGGLMAQYDARYVAHQAAAGERPGDSLGALMKNIPVLMRRHFTENLGLNQSLDDYRGIAPGVEAWTWDGTLGPGGPFLDYDYQARISEAFAANPRFRLMLGTGYYDLTTTIGPARYLVTRSDYPRERVFHRQYVGGHMAYTHQPSHQAFTSDIRAWVSGGSPA